MTVSLKTLRDAVATKLESLDTIQEVKKYLVVWWEWYPLACVVPVGLDNSLVTNKEEFRVYGVKIVLQQETQWKGEEASWDILLDVFDQVLEAFASDWDLNWSINNIRPIPGDFWEYGWDAGKIFYAEITLAIEVISDPIS